MDNGTGHLIGLAGDWHGATAWACDRIAEVAARGARILFHQGDFGIWPGIRGGRHLRAVDAACIEHDVWLYITPGNHEDWPAIDSAPVQSRTEIGPAHWFGERIAVLPRGARFTIGGRSFVSLGGAPSIDFETRAPGGDWWPTEMITSEDVARVTAGGTADVMLTHDAPDAPWQTPAVHAVCSSNPGGWSTMALAYAAIGRRRLTVAVRAVQPKLLVHGHYHVADEAVVDVPNGSCRVISLNCEGRRGNFRFLELSTLESAPAAGTP